MIRERETNAIPGLPVLLGLLAAVGLSIWGVIDAAGDDSTIMVVTYIVSIALEARSGETEVGPLARLDDELEELDEADDERERSDEGDGQSPPA